LSVVGFIVIANIFIKGTELLLLLVVVVVLSEHIKEIMGVKRKPDIINIIEKKRLQW
jgi:hypothetical protein